MTIIDHPLIADRLTRLRDKDCGCEQFRLFVNNIVRLMVPSVTADLETVDATVQTPLESTSGHRLQRTIVLVPILRAGLSLLEGFLELIPEAVVAHIGLRRDHETLEPEVYYPNAPVDLANAEVIVLDPMLATGGSAIEATRLLKEQGATRLRFACLIAAPEGVEAHERAHPDVPCFAAALDRCLNDVGYICPGLGDAGDRSFGTL